MASYHQLRKHVAERRSVDHSETKTDLLILSRIIEMMRSWDD